MAVEKRALSGSTYNSTYSSTAFEGRKSTVVGNVKAKAVHCTFTAFKVVLGTLRFIIVKAVHCRLHKQTLNLSSKRRYASARPSIAVTCVSSSILLKQLD